MMRPEPVNKLTEVPSVMVSMPWEQVGKCVGLWVLKVVGIATTTFLLATERVTVLQWYLYLAPWSPGYNPLTCLLMQFPDRSGVYLQCSAVYTANTLQFEQCSWSVHCPCSIRYTAGCRVHCLYTPLTFVHCREYTARTVQFMQCSCSVHCTVYAAYMQSYTACTLQLHCMYTPLWSGLIK